MSTPDFIDNRDGNTFAKSIRAHLKALRLAGASLGSGATLIKMGMVMPGCSTIVIMALDTQETHWGIKLGL